MIEDKHFAYQPKLEENNHPDFLFPNRPGLPRPFLSQAKTQDVGREDYSERPLAAGFWKKPNGSETKHLLTLDQGVSENQFQKMNEAGIRLVDTQVSCM